MMQKDELMKALVGLFLSVLGLAYVAPLFPSIEAQICIQLDIRTLDLQTQTTEIREQITQIENLIVPDAAVLTLERESRLTRTLVLRALLLTASILLPVILTLIGCIWVALDARQAVRRYQMLKQRPTAPTQRIYAFPTCHLLW